MKRSVCKSIGFSWTWRNITVAFRVSPEEVSQIETLVSLTGMTKQDYIMSRLLHRDVIVKGNPRIFKALRDTMGEVLTELRRIEAGESIDRELIALIETIAAIMGGLKEERK